MTGRRKNWCSDDCVQQYMAIRCGTGLRKAVMARDQGVCAACGLDCVLLRERLRKLQRINLPRWREVREALGVNKPFRVTFWDADHIVAVADGGGSCPISNIRTLCLWCHNNNTAAQVDRKAGRGPVNRPPGAEIVRTVLEG